MRLEMPPNAWVVTYLLSPLSLIAFFLIAFFLVPFFLVRSHKLPCPKRIRYMSVLRAEPRARDPAFDCEVQRSEDVIR